MSAGPTQTNKIQSPEGMVRASHVIYGEPQDRYLRLFRALLGIDEHIHTYAAKCDPERREVRFDTNGKALRDWDD
jgi:hypothetical protein